MTGFPHFKKFSLMDEGQTNSCEACNILASLPKHTCGLRVEDNLVVSKKNYISDNIDGDWQEDFSLENGNYRCKCLLCGNYFMGYKRRVCCKICAENSIADKKNEAIEFVKWVHENYLRSKERYRHKGDFYHNDKPKFLEELYELFQKSPKTEINE